MARKETPLALEVTKVLTLVVIAVALIVGVLQLDNLEEHALRSSRRLEALDERIARLAASPGPSAAAPAAPTAPAAAPRRWLHPEVPNALEPDTFAWVAPEAVPGGTITRWYGSDPKGLNPLTENGSDVSENVEAYVREAFAERHYQNPDKFAPRLAERIEVTDDYREYTVYLRPGVKWHSPAVDWSNARHDWLKGDHEVTADDVKFTVDLILNPQVEAASLRNYYEDLESCRVVDPHTVVFRWKRKTYNSIAFTIELAPIPKFLYGADEDGRPFPPETLGLRFNEHWYNQRAIGTGPYRFVSWEQGVAVKLTRNEAYWGPKPAIKDVTWLIFTDQKTNLLKFKSKELDYARLYPSDYREEIVEAKPGSPFLDGRAEHDFFLQMGYYHVAWNQARPMFADKRVRRAMTLCLDRERIVKNAFVGLGVVPSGPFFVDSPYNDPALKPLPYDLPEAKRLLDEAGWRDTDGDGVRDKVVDGRPVRFEFTFLLYASSPEWKALAALYKESLYQVGVLMNAVEVEWSVMQKRLDDRDFDAVSAGWAMSWDPDPYQIWHSSQAAVPKSSNTIGFKSAEADRLIERLRETFDRGQRIELCRQFHKVIHDEQPFTFVYTRKRVLAWWAPLKRVTFRAIRPQDVSLPWWLEGR